MSPAAETPVTSPAFPYADIGEFHPSPLNPRKTISESGLEELAQSIREKGVLDPLLVRPAKDGPGFEIVDGERRYRASTRVGLKTLPYTLQVLSDAELIEVALTKGHHGVDVHPLEEADALQLLLDMDRAYTETSLAKRLGVSKAWVRNHLKLLRLDVAVQDAYRSNSITSEHADEIAQVPPHQQAAALRACFSPLLFNMTAHVNGAPEDVEGAIEQRRWDLLAGCLLSPAELRAWIRKHTVADIADEAVQETMPGLRDALEDAAADQAALVQLSDDPTLNESQAKALGVIRRVRWIEISESADPVEHRISNERCENMKDAAVTHPPEARRLVSACWKRSCPTHRPAPVAVPGESATDRARREERAEEERQKQEAKANERERVWVEEQRPRYLAALAALATKKFKTVTPDLVKILVEDFTLDEIEKYYGLVLSPRTALTVLVLSAGPTSDYGLKSDSQQLERFGRTLGLPLAQWQRDDKKATKPRAAKTTAKKSSAPARKAKKGGR